MTLRAVTHEAGEVASPQLCARCGAVLVPPLRAPYVPRHAILWHVDDSQEPEWVTLRLDTTEKLANIPWCNESKGSG